MRRSTCLLLLLPLFGLFAVSPNFGLRVGAPEFVEQGMMASVAVSIEDGGIRDQVELVEFAYIDPTGRVHASTVGFRLPSESDPDVWIGLLGISPIAVPGDYRLRVRVHADAIGLEAFAHTEVLEGPFSEMRISLSRRLTQLLTQPDPDRARESRELQELLAQRNVDALNHVGRFVVPVDYRRQSAGFGDRRIYEYSDSTTSTSVHWGVDYAAAEGTVVRASGDGRVVMARERILSGKTVIVEHLPGVLSLYYHLGSLEVDEGSFVAADEEIGTVGMTGFATGPHLHWEVRVAGQAVSPEWFLSNPVLDTSRLMAKIEL